MDSCTFIKHAEIFGIQRREAGLLYQELSTWVASSGPEWTVKRMKILKQFIVGSLKLRPDSGFLKGSWGRLCKSKSVALVDKLNMVHFYHTFVADEPTVTQLTKFYGSMTSEDSTGLTQWPDHLKLAFYRHPLNRSLRIHTPLPFLDHPFNTHKSIPSLVPGRFNEGHKGMDLLFFTKSIPLWDWFQDARWLWENYLYREIIPFALKVADEYFPQDIEVVGKIGFIQEPGFKLRAVANPNRVAQWLLDPLKDLFMSYLQVIDNDCTHDQEKGVRRVQGWLGHGMPVSSVDLSDATNLFPRCYQLRVAELVIGRYRPGEISPHIVSDTQMRQLLRLFETMCEHPWSCPDGVERRFTRGQPLGLGPSFPLFALSHHAVLQELGISEYVILGDDICIRYPTDCDRYIKKMDSLGAKVSQEKSLTSEEVAEFGGKIITSKRVVSKYKWQPIRHTNVLDILRVHGPRLLALVPESMLDVVPTLCTLPRYLGGCGFTLTGRYQAMVRPELAKYLKEITRQDPLRSYVSVKRHYTDVIEELLSHGGKVPDLYTDRLSDAVQARFRDLQIPDYAGSLPPDWRTFYIPRDNPKMLSSSSLVRAAKRFRM
jgi:hypothetical protein